MPRNKQQGEECGECQGSGAIGLMPSINIGPTLGCGSCASGLDCVKEDENQKVGRCQSSNFSQPPGSFSTFYFSDNSFDQFFDLHHGFSMIPQLLTF